MKKRSALVCAAVIASIAVGSLAGCSAKSTAPAVEQPTMPATTAAAAQQWDMTVADGEEVHSLEEANAAATVVLHGVAGSSHVESIGDVPFTVTTVSVTDVVSGDEPGRTVDVRQFGDANNTSDELASLLQSGKDYLLYLQPFEFEPGESTGQYVVVGGNAAWEQTTDGRYEITTRESELPTTLTDEEVETTTSGQ